MPRTITIFAFLLFLFARTALAEPAARLHYVRGEGAESCADEASMRRAVAVQLGYDPFDDKATTFVKATVAKKGGRLAGRVEVQRPGSSPGTRDLSSRDLDCTSLSSAMALAISLAIDPLAITRARAPELAPLPPPAPAPSPETRPKEEPPASVPAPTPEPPRNEAPRPSTPIRFRAGLSGHGALGIAPSPAFGFGASVGLRWPHVSLNIEGRANVPARASLSTGGEVNTWTAMGMLVPCAHAAKIVVVCAMGAVGSMQGESKNVTNPGSDQGLYAAVGARAGIEVPLSAMFSIRPEIDVLVAVARPSVELNGRTIWTVPPLSGSLGIALILQL